MSLFLFFMNLFFFYFVFGCRGIQNSLLNMMPNIAGYERTLINITFMATRHQLDNKSSGINI